MKPAQLMAGFGVAFAMGIGQAQAVTATFDLSGNDRVNWPGLPYNFTLSQGGLDLTVSGHSLTNGQLNTATNRITAGTVRRQKVGRYSGGLGIVTRHDDDHQIDGRSSPGGDRREIDEFIQFSFSKPVLIHAADFSFVGSNDDFRWLADTNGNGRLGVGDFLSPLTDIPSSTIFTAFNGTVTDVFGIGAFTSNDEWKLRSIKVKYSIPTVPLPAGLPMFFAALGMLGMLGWRRKTA